VVSTEHSSGGVRVVSEDGEEAADPGSAAATAPPPSEPGIASAGGNAAGGDGGGEQTLVDRLAVLVVEHRTRVIWGVATFVLLGIIAASQIDLGGVLVFGISTGSVYALVALGIVLVYRSTKVLNFAQGEFGTMPAFLVLMLLLGFDRAATVNAEAVSTLQLASFALVGVAFGAILAIGVNALIVQRLAEANPVTSLVATAGVSLLMIGFQIVTFELQNRTFPRFFPGTVCVIPGADGCVLPTNRHNLVILIVLVVVGVAFAALFRTELGTALLAVAQDPFAASLHGVSPRAMSMLAWGLAGALGALGGILGAGFFEGLTPGLMTTTFLLPAFTAVILGGITSMPGAVVGGLLVGLTAALANGAVTGYGLSNVPNPPTLASFALLLVVLLVKPSGLFGKGA
jgi:branched-chain amino acid transport system permease protein